MMRWVFPLVLLLATFGLLGCNIVGYAAYALKPPTKVPAAFTLGTEPTLVVVENAQQPQVGEIVADQLRALVVDDLEDSIEDVVLVDRFESLSFDMAKRQLTLREMGEDAGATRVIYVDLRTLRVAAITGTDSYVGRGEANVKVYDVETGAVLFPTTQAGGIPVVAQTEREPFKNNRSDEVRIKALKLLAGNVARIFHEYTVEEDE